MDKLEDPVFQEDIMPLVSDTYLSTYNFRKSAETVVDNFISNLRGESWKAPKVSQIVKGSYEIMIKALTEQITKRVKELIHSDPVLLSRKNELMTVPGIGEITALTLLALMPELGSLTRRQVASLAGLAPRANDSGKLRGYRHTAHGRDLVKPALFLAAMAARNSHSPLKAFYEDLIKRGKKKMVALTALMRKIIVIANAKLKSLSLNSLATT